MFLRNAWYAAAWDREVGQEILPRKILGERIALYRTEAGEPVALEDACPHRKLPLSMGHRRGDAIECGYHGLTFDRTGRCIHAPAANRIPPAVRVRSYPLVSRYGLLWIWMGDASKADPDRIFQVEHWNDSRWGHNRGGDMLVDCDYRYVTDNLLDPSHVAWVHATSFGNEACQGQPIEVEVLADRVIASRWILDAEVAPFYAKLVPFAGRCDRLQHYEVRFPSHAITRAVFVPVGTGGKGKPLDERALLMDSYNFMTPVDAGQTRYFWFQLRNRLPEDTALSQLMDEGVRAAFEEDRAVLTAVHRGFAEQQTAHVDLASDRAPLQFRRGLERLIVSERADSAPPDAATLPAASARPVHS